MEYLDTKRASEVMNVGINTVSRWCKEGKLQAKKNPGGEWAIPRSSIDKVLSGEIPSDDMVDISREAGSIEAMITKVTAEKRLELLQIQCPSVEEYIERVKTVTQREIDVSEKEKKVKAHIEIGINNIKEEYNKDVQKLSNEKEDLIQEVEMLRDYKKRMVVDNIALKERVKELEGILNIKTAEEKQYVSDYDYFNGHYQQGIVLADQLMTYIGKLPDTNAKNTYNVMKKHWDYICKATVEKWREQCYETTMQYFVNIMQYAVNIEGIYQDYNKEPYSTWCRNISRIEDSLEEVLKMYPYKWEIMHDKHMDYTEQQERIKEWERID